MEEKDYLLLVSNSAFFETLGVSSAILDIFNNRKEPLSFSQLINGLNGKWGAVDAEEGFTELKRIQAIQQVDKITGSNSVEPKIPSGQPITTLICLLSHNCNLNCDYCYAEQGYHKGNKGLMKEDTAFKSVDFLIEQSGQSSKVYLTFFGGEPLLNFPVIKSMVSYGRKKAGEAKKIINFSMTTNATLFTREMIEFLNNEDISITVSIDGPKEIHDKVRKYPDGKGSYEIVRNNISELFKFYKNRRVGARVTVTQKAVNIKDILFHLLEMGFHEVGFSPVSTTNTEYALSEGDLKAFTQQFQDILEIYVGRVINNEYMGFSNLSNLLRQIHEGTNRPYPCGGGIGLMGIDADGNLYVCHRLIGNKNFSLGNLRDGIDRKRQEGFLSEVHLERKEKCKKCWARYFCGGGCYHEVSLHNRGFADTPSHYCYWLKQWIELGIKAYIRISDSNPDFIKRFIDNKLIC